VDWREFRLEKSGRRGWDIALPRFEDGERPEDADRMNRFYDTAAAEMEKAAELAARTEARRVRYRCETAVRVLTADDCALPAPEPEKKRFFFRFPIPGRKDRRKRRDPAAGGRPGDVRVSLRLTLAVSGQWTREKTLVHLWRDGALMSSRVLL